MTRYDVVTLGETMLRLTPANYRRLEQASALDIEIGGTESNMAIGLARLGLKALWLSRLTDNPMGRLIASGIAAQGVDTSHVVWTDHDRVGVIFFEIGKAPRGSRVIYDRQGSAVSRMRPEDLPRDLFQPDGARVFHTTGVTLALTPTLTDTAHQALHLAKAAGWRISFDVNYRRTLWKPAAAREGCEAYAKAADLLFIPRGDACELYELDPQLPAERIVETLAECYPQATIALTLGADGALGWEPGGAIVRQTAFPAEEVDRLGGGDAFAAGFLCGYLNTPEAQDRLTTALQWGAATAALKYTIPGDAPMVERHEVDMLVQQGTGMRSIQR